MQMSDTFYNIIFSYDVMFLYANEQMR